MGPDILDRRVFDGVVARVGTRNLKIAALTEKALAEEKRASSLL